MVNRNVTCRKCGWVHQVVSERQIAESIVEFKQYWHTLSPLHRYQFGHKPLSIRDFLHCMKCDAFFKNFRESHHTDVPPGCAIGSILDPNTKLD